jgi:hypothetical protein
MKVDFTNMLGIKLTDVAGTSSIRPIMKKSCSDIIGDKMHMDFKEVGLGFVASLQGHVESIQFYSEGFQEHREFSDGLPEHVEFSQSLDQVQQALGDPDVKGGGAKLPPPFGVVPPWIRYDREAYSLHLQFSEDRNRIVLVSLMRPDIVPK